MPVVTKTVKPGGDYTSLSAFEAGQQRNLVTANEIARALCGNFSDTTNVVWGGWTTDASHYVLVEAEQNHNGAWSTGAYRLTSSSGSAIQMQDGGGCNHAKFVGIQIDKVGGTNGFYFAQFNAGVRADTYWIERTIVRATGNASVETGVRWQNGTGGTLYMSNNLMYDILPSFNSGIGVSFDSTHNPAAYLYNNTVIAANQGYKSAAGRAVLKNCVYYSQAAPSATFGDASWGAGTDYNATDITGSNLGSNSRQSQTFTFVDESNDDFHVTPSDTAVKGFGLDLSADSSYPISLDIDGFTRTAAWDIGADAVAQAILLASAGFSRSLSAGFLAPIPVLRVRTSLSLIGLVVRHY